MLIWKVAFPLNTDNALRGDTSAPVLRTRFNLLIEWRHSSINFATMGRRREEIDAGQPLAVALSGGKTGRRGSDSRKRTRVRGRARKCMWLLRRGRSSAIAGVWLVEQTRGAASGGQSVSVGSRLTSFPALLFAACVWMHDSGLIASDDNANSE